MSHDLRLRAADSPSPSREAILAYFQARRHYEVDDGWVSYANPDTGASFNVHIPDQEDPGRDPAGPDPAGPDPAGQDSAGQDSAGHAATPTIHFSMSYGRPHVFALEAELELSAFIRRFDLRVAEDSSDGPGRCYSRDAFLSGWNAGNDYTQRLTKRDGDHRFLMPRARLEAVWQWNFARDAFTASIEARGYVPTIYLLIERDLRLVTSVVWTEGIPIALPQVDVIVVESDDPTDVRFLRYADVAPLLRPFASRSGLRIEWHDLVYEVSLPFHAVDPEDWAVLCDGLRAVRALDLSADSVFRVELASVRATAT